ncbi:hypothetical protein [Corynebacterium aquatimens]|uniref:Uncharacterized protein n=1 Tax=Corynebacterium aquatimens TaxID=1190508 RepID=A0A931E0Q4_9CORY|nr:hypothetical protein [Corynebacterium aquatimens]MBG6122569.1 hypothetical protein [Corynebacterium aquatimens]WJY64891.1 hypothetical protein CAQUA_00740 [Corynebacterium aquatimens]
MPQRKLFALCLSTIALTPIVLSGCTFYYDRPTVTSTMTTTATLSPGEVPPSSSSLEPTAGSSTVPSSTVPSSSSLSSTLLPEPEKVVARCGNPGKEERGTTYYVDGTKGLTQLCYDLMPE